MTGEQDDLEPISSIAEREFPELVEEIKANTPVPDTYSHRKYEKLWYAECQESRMLNTRGRGY